MKDAIAPNLDFLFGEVPFTGVDVPLRYFDCSDTEKDTGFKAAISFGEGCKRTMNWWKMQKDCLQFLILKYINNQTTGLVPLT